MRLAQIEIKDYKQFEHLELDLTYPEGHANAGKSLDKICIIGDNGTGKTTILNVIKEKYAENYNNDIYKSISFIDISSEEFDFSVKKLLFFPTGPDLSNLKEMEVSNKSIINKNSNRKIYDLSDEKTYLIYRDFINEIKENVDEELAIIKENFVHQKIDIVDTKNMRKIADNMKEAADKLEDYRKENPNNLEQLKKYLDPLLNRFHLELDTRVNFDNLDEEFFLKIRAKNGKAIPLSNWSTGIRQLIYNILPLYVIETGEDTVILIDEPERSLYPNTQKTLVDFYTSISPKSQFIFATHSPIIAAQFEPWEIIDLRFNEKGKVERKLYYDPEKGNHVDNYFIHPKYLRWDSLFELMFGLEEESNPERTKKLEELAILNRKIKKESNKEKKKEMWEEYQKLANLLDWKTNGSVKTGIVTNEKN